MYPRLHIHKQPLPGGGRRGPPPKGYERVTLLYLFCMQTMISLNNYKKNKKLHVKRNFNKTGCTKINTSVSKSTKKEIVKACSLIFEV